MSGADTPPTGRALSAAAGERRRFEMKACLGRGGFGEVYRATMTSAGGVRSEVAVKVLHAEVDPNSQAVQRLRDEGRLLGAVRHPSVLRVHDLVVLDGRVALVTEYVEGQDLDKCIGSHPLPPRALLEVVAKVAEALAAAFDAPTGDGRRLELVHRDIKPANVRLGRHGEVKLLDFGIARAANADREARTDTNAMLGSYLYMAPERFLENTDAGPAVDVYSLGLTLYEGLTGRRVFGELTLKEMYLLILEPARYVAFVNTALDAVPRDVPHQVVALIDRALALDPAARPGHAELSRACHEIADRLPGQPTLDQWARRREWPPQRTVRGVLDGSVLTEEDPSALVRRAALGPPPPRRTDDGSLDLVRTATATLERPGVVVGVGLGLFGLSSALVVLGGLAVVGVVALVLALRGPSPAAEAEPPADPVRQSEPPADLARQSEPPDPPSAAAAPVPPMSAAPLVRTPPAPAPTRPPPVEAPPDPAPVPRSEPPRPAPAAPDGVVEVQGGVLVEFRGPAGTFRAGRVPAGTWQIRAFLGGSWVEQEESLYVTPGARIAVKCSNALMKCWVVR